MGTSSSAAILGLANSSSASINEKKLPPNIEHALQKTSGANFYRCALQVNPAEYLAKYRGVSHGYDEASYIDALLEKAIELDIHVMAITDHNHVGSIDRIRAAAKPRGVYIFPGFELATSEGVHVLCIYPLDIPTEKLNRYLGEFGIRDTDHSSNLSNKNLTDVLETVALQKGITIAAHVTNDKGLLYALKNQGQGRVEAWRNPKLIAIQIPGAIDSLLPEDKQIIRNKNQQYKREDSPEPDLAIAVVNARDVARPEDLAHDNATCWIKMSEVSIEGLRQAFLDPGSRIRLNSAPVPDEHTELVAMSWEGEFLDGAAVHFNKNLNVIIGGRGTGKSTVIESLRYALDIEPLGEDARKAHEGIVKNVLRAGTKISLLVRSHHPAIREYLIERTVPQKPAVRDMFGQVLNIKPVDVISNVEIYGQHEIAELTKSPDKLTYLLSRFIENSEDVKTKKIELRGLLQRSRRDILDKMKTLEGVAKKLSSLPPLEEKLKQYKESGIEERLKEKTLVIAEEQVFKTANERVAVLRDAATYLSEALPIDRDFVSSKALSELPGKSMLSGVGGVLSKLEQQVKAAITSLDQAFSESEKQIAKASAKWMTRKREVSEQCDKILRELQKTKIDGGEFIKLREKIAELTPLRKQEKKLKADLDSLKASRQKLLDEYEEVKGQEFSQVEKAAKKINKKLRSHIRLTIQSDGDCEPLCEFLRDKVGGRIGEALTKLREVPDFSLAKFAAACRDGHEKLITEFGFIKAQAEKIVNASADVVMQIEEIELPITTRIELNTASETMAPVWQKLENLSTGQKATAILFLLLLDATSPLIMDQPEDDLDVRFITHGIVPRMRSGKQQRQFVFSTHNANIPVLGDAELIIGMSNDGETEDNKALMLLEHMGSIDKESVCDLVKALLEGGRAAFEVRRRKYGF